MFQVGDPEPEPFTWGPMAWTSPDDCDKERAEFLGDLACGRDVPEVTRGLARRALLIVITSPPFEGEPNRLWRRLFAVRVLGPDCPPAKGLPEDMRRQLEELVAEFREKPAAPATAPGRRRPFRSSASPRRNT